MQRGNKVTLTELHVSDSSEAILSGRKPPFRLLVRALTPEGVQLKIRHAISEVCRGGCGGKAESGCHATNFGHHKHCLAS